jgi:pimeloyl-ACP methyl ester carboxylesterase
MKINRGILKLSASILLLTTVVTSCKKSDSNSKNYTYFVSKEFVAMYKQDYINTLLSLVSSSVPDVNSLKPLVTTDINVYKIIYKTTINGKQLNASGLICVPVTTGEYPVLSFQNGTNTVNANAPSENPSDINYQMVELLASMGYIVVIADYPGFGESAQIPHPYLITEPTVRSLVDLLYTVKEIAASEFSGITLKNDYYLLGYSQGGWATLALHKALELDYSNDFNLIGSSCGAGPYNISDLLEGIVTQPTYPVPAYLAYIVSAYSSYNQFTNPVSDIFNEPYASRLSTLFNGINTSGQIDSQLTTSIPGLITPEFLTGFLTDLKYSSIRDALDKNSIAPWRSNKSLLFTHGGSDTEVNPSATENMYSSMIQAGTSTDICKKIIIPGADHGSGLIPCMIQGFMFLHVLSLSN